MAFGALPIIILPVIMRAVFGLESETDTEPPVQGENEERGVEYMAQHL